MKNYNNKIKKDKREQKSIELHVPVFCLYLVI